MKVPSAILLITLFLISCQSTNIIGEKSPCSSLDWFELGRADGAQGLESLSWQQKEKTCSGFSETHHESYVNGWYGGVDDFCSSSHGFAYGKSGHEYNSVCPAGREAAFLDSYRKGKKVLAYESESLKLSQELRELTQKASNTEPDKALGLLKKITELETRIEFNQALISEIQREMDESDSSSSTL